MESSFYRSKKMEQMLNDGNSVLVIGSAPPMGSWDAVACNLDPRDIQFLAKAANAVFYREQPPTEISELFQVIVDVDGERAFRNPDYKGESSS